MQPPTDVGETRLADLESRLAFQEHAIESLSDTVAAQQVVIETLGRKLDHLAKRTREFSQAVSNIDPGHEPPPHY